MLEWNYGFRWTIFWLDAILGILHKVSNSEVEFREMADTSEKRRLWFAEPETQALAKRGLNPNFSQCIGFSLPVVSLKAVLLNRPMSLTSMTMSLSSEACTDGF